MDETQGAVMGMTLLEGNEAVALGAMAAGCRFFAGYPITPATSIYQNMLQLLPPQGGVCMQGEDEIASIGFCLGASMAGLKAMTATSGPGISLYSEQIGFAIGSEIPLVIVDVQRLGPSTGSATRGADGDVQFLNWASSGGQPVIVLAPEDVKECYTLTAEAFNLAETYRCPVFVASNKEIAMTKESVDLDAVTLPEPIDRRPPPAGQPFQPFAAAPDSAPGFLPIGDDTLVRQTSSTHGVNGYITVDPDEIQAMQDRLNQKLMAAVDRFARTDYLPADGAETLVVTYGVTARAAREAVQKETAGGHPVSLLVLKTLWPVPEAAIRRICDGYRRIVVAEMNLGQYVREIERIAAGRPVAFLGQMDGRLITPDQIVRRIAHAESDK